MSYLCDVSGGGVRELSGLHLMSEEEAAVLLANFSFRR